MTGRAEPRMDDAGPGRLKTRAEFLAARAGERRKGPLFVLEVLERGPSGPPRVGFTVTKRQGNAVERNRIRRRLREAIRCEAGFAMQPGHDYVVVARHEVLDASFSRLTAALKDRIEKPEARPHRGPGASGKSGRLA